MNPDPQPSIVKLPGIGDRLDVHDAAGGEVRVVRRKRGDVAIHLAATSSSIEFDPATAASVGAFLAGHYTLAPRLAGRINDALGALVFDWVRVGPDAHAVGKTIAELEVRRRTAVTIVAVLRGSIPLVAPEPETRLEAGDDLVIAARRTDRDRFERFIRGGP